MALTAVRLSARLAPLAGGCLPLLTRHGMSTLERKQEKKRFYKDVSLKPTKGGYQLLLDGRGVKTPKGQKLVLPNEVVALTVAAEWQAQKENIRPYTMHMTALSNTAIDTTKDSSHSVKVDLLVHYLETDTVCFRVTSPANLAAKQQAVWDPLIGWYNKRYGVQLATTTGLMSPPHSENALPSFKDYLMKQNPWVFVGLENAISVTHSVVLARAAIEHQITAEEAMRAAYLEGDYQREFWGSCEDEDGLQLEDRAATLAASVLLAATCN